jgi:hypothetical protein
MITNCQFEPNDKGTYTCPICGLTVPRAGINANCRGKMGMGRPIGGSNAPENALSGTKPLVLNGWGKKELQPPPLLTRVGNFIKAATRHTLAGNPMVTEEEMKGRLEICKACELFKPNENAVGGVCTHANCGCNVQDNLNYLNKIAWATESCPVGKWLAIEAKS